MLFKFYLYGFKLCCKKLNTKNENWKLPSEKQEIQLFFLKKFLSNVILLE